jgi:GntR family transcriptional regulator/MocR family aminotransferase
MANDTNRSSATNERRRSASRPDEAYDPRGKRHQIGWQQLLANIDRQKGSLHDQLVHTFTKAIEDGRLAGGLRVPSGRELARMVGIGRNTAALALSDLVQRGYMTARERSGVYVAAGLERPSTRKPLSDVGTALDWNSRFGVDVLSIAAPTRRPVTEAPHINFLHGQFDAGLFPTGHWRECERAASSVLEIAEWGRDKFDGDDLALIECLRKHILPSFGIWANMDEVIVTLGGQEARYLVGYLLCRPNIVVGVEDPGMPDMVSVLRLTGASMRPLCLDEEGLVIAGEMQDCDIVVTTCGHQCPTTAVMSLARRQALLDTARSNDFLLVEDTYETELVSDGDLPSLKGLDTEGRVIHLGSLSKLLAPGLRVGYVVAPAPVIRQLRELRRLIHRHPPGNNQRALAMFIERGYHRAYMQRVERELLQRSEQLRQCLRERIPDFEVRHHLCAASFWVTAPSGISAKELAAVAAQRGVLIEPGDRFFHGRRDVSCFRMSVSSVSEHQIETGVRLLADAAQSLRARARSGKHTASSGPIE